MYEKEFLELKKIRENAYAPYSNFKVAALVIDRDNNKFFGTNVENVSYGLTECAERNAITNGVTQRGKLNIDKIFVLGSNYTTPCGSCRQIIKEFADKNTVVILLNNKGEFKKFNIEELLPHSFAMES